MTLILLPARTVLLPPFYTKTLATITAPTVLLSLKENASLVNQDVNFAQPTTATNAQPDLNLEEMNVLKYAAQDILLEETNVFLAMIPTALYVTQRINASPARLHIYSMSTVLASMTVETELTKMLPTKSALTVIKDAKFVKEKDNVLIV